MRSLRAISALLIMAPSVIHAQERAALLDAVVTAERTFRADAARLGIRRAFLAHIADDGVLFRPGPVKGRTHLEAQEDQPGMLEWEPAFADVSAAGDLGFTTGPWSARESVEDTVAASGFYSTVWTRRGDEWKFVIDHGVRAFTLMPVPQPMAVTSPDVVEAATPTAPGDAGAESVRRTQERTLAQLMQSERELVGKTSGASGIDEMMRLMHASARVQRRKTAPLVGDTAIRSGIGVYGLPSAIEPLGGGVARSDDLAYTYGRYTVTRAAGAEEGHYLRLWRRVRGNWRIVFDLLAPNPPAQPK
jgi:ketosteroid isomerase-like protein